MNNVANQFPYTGLSPRQNNQPDFQSASYTREQSFRSQENLDTGLVIQTRDGDQVTLTSNSFSQMDAYMYDSKGVIQADGMTAAYSQSQREITLASGQSFSFSVQGDLSEDEMEDIEAILKGLDGVIAEMKDGDMSGALDKALEMGGYDTVSSFAADISYQRSYQMSSAVSATTTQVLPANEKAAEVPVESPVSKGNKNGFDLDFDKFFRKMMKQFEAHEDKQIGLAKDPINKLFGHHLEKLEDGDDTAGKIYNVLEKAMNKIDSLIEKMMDKTGLESDDKNLETEAGDDD